MKKIFSLLFIAILAASCSDSSDEGGSGTNLSNVVLTTTTPTNFTLSSATVGGVASASLSSTALEYGVLYAENPGVTYLNAILERSDNQLQGEYNCTLQYLTPGVTYYVKAYAKKGDNIIYGNELSFMIPLPVTTRIARNITASGFEMTVSTGSFNAPIHEKGICWSLSPNPLKTNYSKSTYNGGTADENFIVAEFVQPNKTYYVRSYIVSDSGVYYGNEVTFRSCGYTGESGGYIFYDKGDDLNGWRYLEAAPSKINNVYPRWGCSGTFLTDISNEIGKGIINTLNIRQQCNGSNVAAVVAFNAVISNKDDWFLPSIDELKAMHKLKTSGVMPQLYEDVASSSQVSATHCYTFYFDNGTVHQETKVSERAVWPIRRI